MEPRLYDCRVDGFAVDTSSLIQAYRSFIEYLQHSFKHC